MLRVTLCDVTKPAPGSPVQEAALDGWVSYKVSSKRGIAGVRVGCIEMLGSDTEVDSSAVVLEDTEPGSVLTASRSQWRQGCEMAGSRVFVLELPPSTGGSNETRRIAPPSCALAAVANPPRASAACLTIARPRPDPGSRRASFDR